MYLIQLMHVKNIEGQEDVKNFQSTSENETVVPKKKIDIGGNDSNLINSTKDQLKSVDQIKVFKDSTLESTAENEKQIKVGSFSDLVSLANQDKDMELKYDLEKNVKLVRFEQGKIDINFNENLNKNFNKKLSQSLFKWTKKRWIISLSKEERANTLHEQKIERKKNILESEKNNSVYKKIINTFPDADLVDVKEEND